MSDPFVKVERSKAKDLRQSIAPDKAVGRPRRHKKNPILIEAKALPAFSKFWGGWQLDWHRHRSYRTRSIAEQALIRIERNYKEMYTFRIRHINEVPISET